jgi:hypothetical protein
MQNKVQGLKAIEEAAEGLQRLKTTEDGLSLAKNCGGSWKKRVIRFDTKGRKENDDGDVSRQDDAFRITKFPVPSTVDTADLCYVKVKGFFVNPSTMSPIKSLFRFLFLSCSTASVSTLSSVSSSSVDAPTQH